MSLLTIPVLAGFRQSSISFDGSLPVRAWLGEPGAAVGPATVVPHMDLIQMVRQEPLLRLTFLSDGAVLSRAGSDFMVALPLVFLEGVGLKSYDLTGTGLPLREAGSLAVAA